MPPILQFYLHARRHEDALVMVVHLIPCAFVIYGDQNSNSCPNSASSVFARRHKQAVVRDHLLETFLSTQVLPMGYRIGLSKAAKALYVSSWRIVKFLHTLERTLLWHQKELISGQALSKTSLAELNWRPCTMWWHLFVSMDLSQRQMSGQHSTFKKLTTGIVMWLWEGINDLHFIVFSPPSLDCILLFCFVIAQM